MNLTLNQTSFLEQIAIFENYIKSNYHEFDTSDGKNKKQLYVTDLAFKLFELEEFQIRAKAYCDFLNYCVPKSELRKEGYLKKWEEIHGFLFWLLCEIIVTEKALQR